MATKLEFKNSPQEVTVREKLTYTFDLANWLAAGESVSTATAKLLDDADNGEEITGAISGLAVNGGNSVTLTADWSIPAIGKNRSYVLLIKATIGSQFKEGFARFKTFNL
ncbi:MAG: hypothetical protein AB1631_24455 [Acidobacteriota bacterium]